MKRISDAIEQVRFFELPSVFKGVTGRMTSMREPAPEYSLEVRQSGRTHVVAWTDYDAQPASQEALRLREMFKMMIAVIDEHPDVKRLPNLGCCCL
jgi:hypothetical protein